MLGSAAAAAQTKKPLWGPPKIFTGRVPKATVKNQMVATLTISDVSIVLEETDLVVVSTSLGGQFGRNRDASLSWSCFGGRNSDGPWALWVESSESEAGKIAGFQWQMLGQDERLDQRCRMLGNVKVELPITVTLGTRESEVLTALGRPSQKSGRTFFYLHEHELTIHGEPFDLLNSVEILRRAGRVWAIEVWQTTTN
jgi:hypothetical protein